MISHTQCSNQDSTPSRETTIKMWLMRSQVGRQFWKTTTVSSQITIKVLIRWSGLETTRFQLKAWTPWLAMNSCTIHLFSTQLRSVEISRRLRLHLVDQTAPSQELSHLPARVQRFQPRSPLPLIGAQPTKTWAPPSLTEAGTHQDVLPGVSTGKLTAQVDATTWPSSKTPWASTGITPDRSLGSRAPSRRTRTTNCR